MLLTKSRSRFTAFGCFYDESLFYIVPIIQQNRHDLINEKNVKEEAPHKHAVPGIFLRFRQAALDLIVDLDCRKLFLKSRRCRQAFDALADLWEIKRKEFCGMGRIVSDVAHHIKVTPVFGGN